jgi:hypothetical protein
LDNAGQLHENVAGSTAGTTVAGPVLPPAQETAKIAAAVNSNAGRVIIGEGASR